MAKGKVDFETVRRIGLAFPGVEEASAYGARALKLRGNLLACEPTHRTAEPGSLAVKLDDEDRAALLAEAPDVYYLPDHYVNFNSVLVRLARIDSGALRDLLGMAHKFVARKAPRRSPSPKKRKARPK
jgi:hypothetical protein